MTSRGESRLAGARGGESVVLEVDIDANVLAVLGEDFKAQSRDIIKRRSRPRWFCLF